MLLALGRLRALLRLDRGLRHIPYLPPDGFCIRCRPGWLRTTDAARGIPPPSRGGRLGHLSAPEMFPRRATAGVIRSGGPTDAGAPAPCGLQDGHGRLG